MQLGTGSPTVLSRSEYDQEPSGPDGDCRKLPLVQVLNAVGQVVAFQVDLGISGIKDLDPVGIFRVFILDGAFIKRLEFRNQKSLGRDEINTCKKSKRTEKQPERPQSESKRVHFKS